MKRLRRERGLNQSQMADGLGISASYLNHLERNQRPVTAGILLRLAEAFDVDVKAFASEGGDSGGATQLARSFPTRCSPTSASAVTSWSSLPTMRRLSLKASRASTPRCAKCSAGRRARNGGADPRSLITPETWVRDYIQAQRNHYPELEEASETLGGALNHPLSVAEPLRQRLKEAWGVEVASSSPKMLEDASQNYDPQRRDADAVVLAPVREPHLRHRLPAALLEFSPIIARMLEAARPPDPGSRRLLHMSFANYAAGAIMMPYGKFLGPRRSIATRSTGCTAQFGANVEQVAHRLTTLEPARRQRRAVLHAARRSGREHLEALRRRELPLLALRRHLPALAPAHRIPDARARRSAS